MQLKNTYSISLLVLCSVFSTIVIAGNVFALKFAMFGSLATPAGMLCFPFTYSLGDVITEIYGYEIAKKVILIGLINLLLFYVFTQIVIWLPPAPTWHLQSEFAQIFKLSTRLFLGTVIGYFCGELLNSRILSALKYITNGKIFIPRSISSTIIGVTTDTILFNLTAFLLFIPLKSLFSFILQQYILKICFEIVGSIIGGKIVTLIKGIEKTEVTDKYTFKWIEKYRNIYSKSNSDKNPG